MDGERVRHRAAAEAEDYRHWHQRADVRPRAPVHPAADCDDDERREAGEDGEDEDVVGAHGGGHDVQDTGRDDATDGRGEGPGAGGPDRRIPSGVQRERRRRRDQDPEVQQVPPGRGRQRPERVEREIAKQHEQRGDPGERRRDEPHLEELPFDLSAALVGRSSELFDGVGIGRHQSYASWKRRRTSSARTFITSVIPNSVMPMANMAS